MIRNFPENRTEEYDERFRGMRWNDDPESLEAWKEGRTGVPWIDAGMRQLLAEGWMHNRVRMAVASYLTKNLLIDWREGESHFMRHLLDGDESQNNGNWQWAASIGRRPAALLPDLQPGPPAEAVRSRRRLRAPLGARGRAGFRTAGIWPPRGRPPRRSARRPDA